MSMLQIIEAVANVALSHEEQCECTVCRAAAGDDDAMHACVAAYTRVKRNHEAGKLRGK